MAKRKPTPSYIREEQEDLITGKNNKRFKEPTARDIISIDDILKVPITLSPEQEQLIKLVDKSIITVIKSGPGGGKTFTSIYIALLKLAKGEVEQIVIGKPLIQSADSDMGYIKGTIDEKIAPFMESYGDVLETILSKQQIESLIKLGFLKFVHTGFLRGRTFKNSIIISDESQSITLDGLYLITSRVGCGSKLLILGDFYQSDLVLSKREFPAFVNILSQLSVVSIFEFPESHNYRNPFIIELTKLYQEYIDKKIGNMETQPKTKKQLLKD